MRTNALKGPDVPASPPDEKIMPVAKASIELGIPLPTLRDRWYHASDRVAASGERIQGNGFGPAFLKLGRSLYVDVNEFIRIWRATAQGSR